MTALTMLPLSVVVAAVTLTLSVWSLVRLLSIGLVEGHHPVHGRHAWQAWAVLRVLDEARTWLFPLYSSWLTPVWLRSLGARIGKDVEASTVLLIPVLTTVGDGAFLADDTLLGGYELGGGWLRVGRVKVGKHAFVGNSGMTAPGRKVPKQGLVAVLSAAPRRTKAKAGTSWLGSPPTQLRRDAGTGDDSRTYNPPVRLRVARATVEVLRLVPVIVFSRHRARGGVRPGAARRRVGWWAAAASSGPVVIAAGAVAAGITSAAKWLAGGARPQGRAPALERVRVAQRAGRHLRRVRRGAVVRPRRDRHPGRSTSGCGRWAPGSARASGARPTGFPRPTWSTSRDGVTVNEGCVVQTHLFHDRMLSMDTVTLRAGATLGPHSVILPAAVLGRHATVGPVSLVMRGESVPDKTRWIGNPIGPWLDEAPGSPA